jgi:hypothetical protein
MMKKSTVVIVIFSISIFFISAKMNFDTPTHKYIGTKSCACHTMASKGKQIDIWQKTKHASAYKALTTEEANKIAKEKGSDKPAAETEACMNCHVAGFGKETAEKYSKDEGVTCEACHGAASDWKPLHSKKDKIADAIDAGLIIPKITELLDKDKPEGMTKVEENCRKCHNDKSPTFKEFNFADMWKQIAHPLPKN